MFDLQAFFDGLRPQSLTPFAHQNRCVFLSWNAALAAFRAGLVDEHMLNVAIYYCGVGATKEELLQLPSQARDRTEETFLRSFRWALTVAATKGQFCWKACRRTSLFMPDLNELLEGCGLAAIEWQRHFTVKQLTAAAAKQHLQIVSMNYFEGEASCAE